ncbi:CopG family ribbon-helix-helix protein [Actinospongicola halichondriae]|uniref:CopG family ribbon-helix-helix protein n=1 Tax=Actinospongicola halichondriae TaxID=3236844 RepID=UPI003D390E00
MPENKSYGRTKSGVEITDELIEQYVAEAEEGLDLDKLRQRGRPRMGAAPAKSFPVRLDPDLRTALDERAASVGRPASEIVREALRRYLAAS